MIINLCHSLVNIFAGGRSETKLILFLIYLPLLLIIFWFRRHKPIRSYPWKYYGFGLGTLYLYGLILQIAYIIQNRLPFFSFFVTGNRYGLSCSSFWHTHIAKGIIAYILSFLGIYRTTTVDSGGAYLEAFPSLIFLFGAILLIALLGANIFYFATSFQKIMAGKNRRQQICLFLGYTIASFSLIKGAIDGGIGCLSCLVVFCFIGLFILKEKKKSLSNTIYLSLFTGAALIGVIGWSLNFSFFYYFNSGMLSELGALIALSTALLYGTEKQINSFLLIMLLVTFIASDWPVLKGDFNFYQQYGATPLNAGTIIYTFNYNQPELEKIYLTESSTIAQITRKLKKNIYYQPITVPGVTCRLDLTVKPLDVIMKSKKYLAANSLATTSWLTIANQSSVKINNSWQTALTITINPCLPQPAIAISNTLQQAGINHYILIFSNNYAVADTD